MFDLISKLLDKESSNRPWLALLDASSAALLERNYKDQTPPKYAKVEMFHYQMAAPLWKLLPKYFLGVEVVWWNRTFEEQLIKPITFDTERKQLTVAELG